MEKVRRGTGEPLGSKHPNDMTREELIYERAYFMGRVSNVDEVVEELRDWVAHLDVETLTIDKIMGRIKLCFMADRLDPNTACESNHAPRVCGVAASTGRVHCVLLRGHEGPHSTQVEEEEE